MKRPAFQFYPADWRKDAALQSCSLAAQGLWIGMMCVMHECDPYGHLMVNGKAMTDAQIARLVGLGERECSRLIGELESAGVPSRTDSGALYCRRMVRDEGLRIVRANGGQAGSEFGILGKEYGIKGGRPKHVTGDKEPPFKPPPSSSSSSSSSTSGKAEAKTKTARKRASESPIPPDFAISERVRRWAEERGHDRLEQRFEHFVGYAKRRGKTYADWDEALMSAIREDWAKLPPANGSDGLSPAGRATAEAGKRWIEQEEARDAAKRS